MPSWCLYLCPMLYSAFHHFCSTVIGYHISFLYRVGHKICLLISCCLYSTCTCLTIQHFSCLFLQELKPKPDVLKFYTKILQYNRSTTVAFCHNDVFECTIARAERYCCQISISLGLLLEPVLPSSLHISSVTCLRFFSF